MRKIAEKIESGSATEEDLSKMFDPATPATKAASPTKTTKSPAKSPAKETASAFAAAETTSGSSSDLTVVTACCLFAFAVAHYAPAYLETKIPQVGPIKNPTRIAVATICMMAFSIGFQFAARWSRGQEHAAHVFRVSFGLASIIVGGYMYSCCEREFRSTTTTATLGFALFEMTHLRHALSLGGYFRNAIMAMICVWSVMLIAEGAQAPTVEYNTYLLLISTVGNILGASEDIHAHFTVGTYLVATLSVFVWAVQNGKIPTENIHAPIKMGVLTFAPTLLAILDHVKPK